MKKRILSLLLVVAMVAAMIVVPVPVETKAAAADNYDLEGKCPCCGVAFTEISDWTEYSGSAKTQVNIAAAGHYRLSGDYSCTGGNSFYLNNITGGGKVVFDLNGYTMTNAGRAFYDDAAGDADNLVQFYVVDSSAEGTGTVCNNGGKPAYGGIWSYVRVGLEFNVYGGNFTTDEYTATSSNNGILFASYGGNMNFYGGSFDQSKVTASEGSGISGFYKTNTGTITISGGTFTGGTSTGGALFNINEGSTLNVTGGTLNGEIVAQSGATITLSKAPTVSSLNLTSGVEADMTGLSEGASVGVTATQGDAFTTAFDSADDATACAAYIDGGSYAVGVDEETNKLYLYVDESVDLTVTQECPHCGGAEADFEPWNFTAGAKAGETGGVTSGHYYLLGDVSDSQTYIGASGSVTSLDVVLDLAGNDFGNTGGRAFYVYKSNALSIMDSSAGKTGVVSGASTASGGVIYTEGDSTYSEETAGNLNLYGVTVTSNAGATTSAKHGGAMYLSGNTYIKDCIINGAAYGTSYDSYGGAIYHRYGTLTMDGTTVNGAKIKYGGALDLHSGSSNITNCIFNGGASSARGGCLYAVAGNHVLTNSTFNGVKVTDRGGIAYIGGATVTFNNCTATGGETTSSSNNYEMTGHGVYANSASANLTINGGSFGTVYSVSSSLTLAGAPTITDLYVWTGLPANVSDMTGGNVKVTVLVSGTTTTGHTSDTGAGVFTNNGLTNTDTLLSVFTSGIEGYVLQVTDDKAMELAVLTFEWYCEACGETVSWTELTDIDDSNRRLLNTSEDTGAIVHYYLSGNMSEDGVVTLGYGSDKVYYAGKWHIDLCGNTYASTGGRAFSLYQGTELAIQSSVAGGKVTAVGTGNGNGGVILTQAAKNIDDVEGNEICTLKLYDVTLQLTGSKKLGSGGVLYMAGSSVLYADGATIDGSAKTNYTYNDTTNSYGGAIYGAALTDITLVNTVVYGGAAYNGGAIYQTGVASMSLDGCTIIGSHVTNNGGSLYKGGGLNNQLTINNTTISGGSADNNGGNVYATGTLVTITGNSTVYGGYATGNGGNFYVTYSDAYIDAENAAQAPQGLTLNGTTVENGTATGGGNMYIVSGAVLTMDGATVSGGTAKQMNETVGTYGRGGNIYMSNAGHTITNSTITGGSSIVDSSLAETTALGGGNIYIMSSGVVTIDGSTITGGSATTNGGNIYVYGSLTLNGGTVSGGTASVQGGDIYVNGSNFTAEGVENQLTLGAAVTADMGVGFSDDMFADGAPFIGKILRTNAAYAELELTLDGNRGGASVTVDSDGYLTVANGYGAIAKQDGSFEYYASSNEALAAFDSTTDAYVKICEEGSELTLTKDVVVDLNGANVTLSGDYTVSGFDSASDLDNHSGGIITLADGATAVNAYAEAADGLLYITYVSADGTTVKFHRAEMDITGVSLRPGADVGIYYWAQWDLDNDLIANSLDTTGVVYNIDDVQYLKGINFEDNQDTAYLYTAIGKAGYSDKTESTGGFMGGFLVAGDEGRTNSAGEAVEMTNLDALGTVVYATTYLALDNGCTYLGDDIVGYSLETLVLAVDSKIVEIADTDKAWVAVNTFATTWLTTENNLEEAIAFANYVAASSEETV